jgi:hypothetical protein
MAFTQSTSKKSMLLCIVALIMAGLSMHNTAVAAPQLQCDVTYAGRTHVVQATPVIDPYPVASVDIAGRFRFKAVMVGDAKRLAYISLYTYFLAEDDQPKLVQQSKYLPPFQTAPHPLTGEQHLYAGPLERELIYSCTLEGWQP